MRTLSEIISAAKSNEPVDVEELRYALCALEGLASFDSMELRRLAEEKKPSTWSRYELSFHRWKAALSKSPKEWLGSQYDPANPEYQKRRIAANKLMNAALAGKLPPSKEAEQ